MEYNYNNNYIFLYASIIKRYKIFLQQHLSSYELHTTEIDIITFLVNNEPFFNNAKDITKYRGISKGLISKHVNTLIRKNILTATKDETDNRLVSLFIADNDDARKVAREIKKYNEIFATQLKKDIPEDTYKIYKEVSKKLYENSMNIEIDE